MREQFKRTIFLNGECGLAIRTPKNRSEGSCGHQLQPDDVTIPKEVITPLVLHMLAEAYYAGYQEAVDDGAMAVHRLTYENSSNRKPSPKISETLDYRK